MTPVRRLTAVGEEQLPRALNFAVLATLLALCACGPLVGAPEPSADRGTRTSGPGASIPPQPRVSIPGKIAFTRAGNIWVFVGSEAHQATTTPGAGDPSWSPDGNILAFDRQEKNSADLFVMPYPQGGPRQLSSNANRVVENNLWEMQPDWSPDATTLAYISDRGRLKNHVLDPAPWRITIATGARAQLANSNQYAGGVDLPRWRPKHRSELVYTSWAYDPQTLQPYGQLVLEDTQTSQAHALTPATETSFRGAWSPDGEHIVFVKRQQQRDDLWLMSLADEPAGTPTAGANPETTRPLLSGRFAQPVWSPDGRSIAYIGLKDGSLDLFVQRLSADLQPDGQPAQLTSGMHLEGASAISWGR